MFRQDEPESEINKLGLKLNGVINCPIRYSAALYNKPVFECNHGVTWALFVLQGARDSGDWSHIKQRHEETIK